MMRLTGGAMALCGDVTLAVLSWPRGAVCKFGTTTVIGCRVVVHLNLTVGHEPLLSNCGTRARLGLTVTPLNRI